MSHFIVRKICCLTLKRLSISWLEWGSIERVDPLETNERLIRYMLGFEPPISVFEGLRRRRVASAGPSLIDREMRNSAMLKCKHPPKYSFNSMLMRRVC